ncbi:transcriptional regulator [Pseudacidovorax intermedius]|uniref:Transcriptional regulator n=1 Tax=Pseudacidovorax intermedius TaxID=433924 RepID=A0A370FSW8_9BURK|nr:MerR family transcriptional regulator [Pseudacidovorax intermedius]RDI29459.1 transcriptional regulator [Pseudacidovorax intermedius]
MPTDPTATDALTIEALASGSGVTVRNIRAYTTAGLLPPPKLRGRLGLYGEEHAQRLELIRALREQGFGIEAIRRVFEQAPASSWRSLAAVAQSISDNLFAAEAPLVVPAEQLNAKWQGRLTPALLDRALRAGLARRLPDGSLQHLSPALARIAEQLAALGLSPEQAIDMQEALVRTLRSVARRWLRTLVDAVLAQPERASALLQQAGPLATGAVQAAFPLILQQELDAFVARQK